MGGFFLCLVCANVPNIWHLAHLSHLLWVLLERIALLGPDRADLKTFGILDENFKLDFFIIKYNIYLIFLFKI